LYREPRLRFIVELESRVCARTYCKGQRWRSANVTLARSYHPDRAAAQARSQDILEKLDAHSKLEVPAAAARHDLLVV